MISNDKLLTQFKKHRQRDEADLQAQHAESRESHEFVAGDSMYYQANVNDKGQRRAVVFNKVQPYVNAVLGTMIQMRRKPDYQARMEDSETQQVFSRLTNNFSDYSREQARIEFLETLQDREMLICGYGAIDTNIGYDRNPDGEVVAEVVRFDDIFWDGQAKEPNLLDARWIRRKKAFTKEEVIARWGEDKLAEFEAYGEGSSGLEYNPDGGQYTATAWDEDRNQGMYLVHYYQWWELVPYFRAKNPAKTIEDPALQEQFVQVMMSMSEMRYNLSDPDTQEDLFKFDANADMLAMTPEQHQDMVKLCSEFGVEFKAVRQTKRCYYTALITGSTVLDKFKSLHQDGFTIKFKTASYDPVRRMWYGMVRGMKNPQEYANKALTEMLFTIASNSKGGVLYEESAVTDPRRFESQYASTKAAVAVADGALSGGKIQPKAQAALPTGYENIHAIADAAMTEVSGISREYLGTAQNKQVSALLESQRINQVLSTLAVFFDAITLYQIEHAKLMLTYLRVLAQNSAGRLIRIMGDNGAAQYIKLNQDIMNQEYDVVVGEAPTTPAQKEQTTGILVEMAQTLLPTGTNIYPLVANYLPIPQEDKAKLIKALTPSPESAQQAQALAAEKAEQEKAINAVMAEATQARAIKDLADADLKRASTAKTLEETGSIAAQTDALRNMPPTEVRVVI